MKQFQAATTSKNNYSVSPAISGLRRFHQIQISTFSHWQHFFFKQLFFKKKKMFFEHFLFSQADAEVDFVSTFLKENMWWPASRSFSMYIKSDAAGSSSATAASLGACLWRGSGSHPRGCSGRQPEGTSCTPRKGGHPHQTPARHLCPHETELMDQNCKTLHWELQDQIKSQDKNFGGSKQCSAP